MRLSKADCEQRLAAAKANGGRRRFLLTTCACATGAGIALNPVAALSQTSGGVRWGIEGHDAPEIPIEYWIDADGKPGHFSVLESRGKWVFLKCFQNWCPGCHSSGFPTLQAFAERFYNHPKVAIAAIQTVFEGYTSNTLEDVRKLQLRYDLPITMGHDPGDPETDTRPVTMREYFTGGTPWLILINPEGKVVFNHYHANTERLIEYVAEHV
jgi:thiol-disulfide isomerase/thioredoxin